MNLRDLKYIVSVADTQHFGKAAQLCFVSQPTLSGQIRKLEEELGVALFERSKRSVEVTPAGQQIIAEARDILEKTGEIKRLASMHEDPLFGPFKVGAIQTLSPYLIPYILKPLVAAHPQMKLVVSEELTETLCQRLHDHELDAALIASEINDPDLVQHYLFTEPFWLAYPEGHELAKKTRITHQDLDKADLLLLSEGHCLADQAMELCHQQRQDMGEMADLRASSLETLLQLVDAGQGSTLIPALALSCPWIQHSAIGIRRLEMSDAMRRVSLVHRRSYPREEAIHAFMDIVMANLPTDSVIVENSTP